MSLYQKLASLVGLKGAVSLSPDEAREAIRSNFSYNAMSDRFWGSLAGPPVVERARPRGSFVGPMPGRMMPRGWGAGVDRLAGIYGRGALSAFLPISPMAEGAGAVAGGATKGFFRGLPSGVRSTGRAVGRTLSKWAGPLITAYRLGTEVPQAQGFGGKISKTVRVIGEEAAWTGGAMAGMAIGSAIGTALLPGAGTVVGGVAGFLIGLPVGYVLGQAGANAVNKAVDIAEAPFRIAAAGYRGLRELGIQSKRLELGGGISAANRTQMAATMRQRALEQMNRSGINARSLLGREASYYHLR